MKLQIALDELTLDEGIELCKKIADHIDIIEIGTPLMMREGVHAVSALRREFPDKEILADSKIMDAGALEAGICFEAGADYCTVLGVTDNATISGCLESAKRCGKRVVVDMMCVGNLKERVEELEALGITDIAVHVGVDQQKAGITPLSELIRMKQFAKASRIYVAGGIGPDTVDEYVKAGADVCIVGGAIAHAGDPVEAAAFLKAASMRA